MKYFLIDIVKGIKVRASKTVIDEWNDEEYKDRWTKKSLEIELNGGSVALLRETPLVFYPQTYFSPLFHSFCSSFVNLKIEELNLETLQIYDYIDTFRSERFYSQFNFERLCKTNEGYLRLNLTEFNNTKKY